ncbi:MAG TPA: hypothetical protein VMI12_03370 [Puia sp.]|nr:hypothetical protein [Puia sp.]
MKLLSLPLFSLLFILVSYISLGQTEWPKVITASDGTIINVYQPQPESFSGKILKSRSAFSIMEKENHGPFFGVYWSDDAVEIDKDNRQVNIESVKITNLKIPEVTDEARANFIKATLETDIPKVMAEMPLDELLASLNQDMQENELSKDISNKLPKLIYSNQRSMLVLIDGVPLFKYNKEWGMDVLINSPFTVVENKDGKYYLYGGGHWYSAPAAVGPYSYTRDKVSHKLKGIARSLEKKAKKYNDIANEAKADKPIYHIIVSTTPAVLIQSDGDPDLVPLEGTSLLYVKNSDNNIFVDTQTQDYYILLAGRWYKSKALDNKSDWEYIASDKLPESFTKIHEGSPKDNVLASVAGTAAAKEAVLDAQIPQTAKIDRRTANTHVQYDGTPSFAAIPGTNLQYAVNTNSTVLLSNGKYYAVDNGIWFVSQYANGPWEVSTDRPDEVDEIPPSSPVYSAKYVYVYDANPDYVYTGYTPGYLNSFIDGSTVVYGTGYYYDPWIGTEYYPRPWTWGFDMEYNPWCGWGFGLGYDFDWFNADFGFGYDDGYDGWGGWYGGWWGGATAYRPAYRSWRGQRHKSDRHGSYYGRNAIITEDTHMSMRYNNNIYRGREGVIRRNNNLMALRNRVPDYRAYNNIFSDRDGNIYQRLAQGQWLQRNLGQWSPVATSQYNSSRNLEQQNQMRVRGQIRTQNFARASNFGTMRFSNGGGFRGGGSAFRGGAPLRR